jgi:RNA polymerase sigma factor (sigma-70 family)
MKDEEIIEHILHGGPGMEKCLESFYRENFRFIGAMSRKYGIDHEDLLDAYADSIIDFRKQIINHQFQHKSKCSTYLFSIFNYKCIDILRKRTTHTIIHELPENMKDTSPDIVQMLTYTVEKDYLDKIMAILNIKCRDILMDWNDGYSMEDIALRNNLLNANVARSKRYTCLQQLMEIAAQNKIDTANI